MLFSLIIKIVTFFTCLVNPIGPRACYDEGKRVAETLSYAYAKQEGVNVRVARIFNTYGPRMHMKDGLLNYADFNNL